MRFLSWVFPETMTSLRRLCLWFCYGDAYTDGLADGDAEGDAYGYADGDVVIVIKPAGPTSEGSPREYDKVNKRGRGRPPKQLSVEEEEIRHKKNIQRNRDYRENKKGKFNRLQEQQELFIEFCEEKGITEEFKAFCEKRNLESEMIQTVGPEGVTAASSSNLEALEARQDKRPAIAYTTPNRPPIGGFMAEARQNYVQSVAALATQGPLLSTNKVTQIQMINAELAEKGKIPKDAPDLQTINAVTLGRNLMKKKLQSMPPGSEFLNLPLLDAIQLCPSLQNQFNEGLTLIGQEHPIDDNVAIQSGDPPVVVPHSVVLDINSLDEATEADNWDWMRLRDPDGGEDL